MLAHGLYFQELEALLGPLVCQAPLLGHAILTDSKLVAMGATYGFSKSAAANLRETDDTWNPAIAGFLAGSIAGLRSEWL